jgi:hypothetical protein
MGFGFSLAKSAGLGRPRIQAQEMKTAHACPAFLKHCHNPSTLRQGEGLALGSG